MEFTQHVSTEVLEANLDYINQAPREVGELVLIVRRPQTEAREVLAEGELSLAEGLVGDNWRARGSSRTPDGSAHPDMQLNIINARFVSVAIPDKARWQWAGDQLFLDLDLSEENLPPGTQLALGETAIIEVTAQPHTGCKKFAERFGTDVTKFINSPAGRKLRLRGINAKVIQPGTIRPGDKVRRISTC